MIVYRAVGFMARFLGWHVFPYKDQALYFARCKAVHSFGLKQKLAIRFVDQSGQAVGDWQLLKPNRILMAWQAYGVIEIAWELKAQRHPVWMAFQQGQNTFRPWRYRGFGQTHCDK